MTEQFDPLKLENQLCFPLYTCAREMVKAYRPYLDELDLTYTQYLTMMALWEHGQLRVRELGECLCLDSSTLTPLLKRLEEKGYLSRCRSREDERELIVSLTGAGQALREKALPVPGKLAVCAALEPEKAQTLYRILYELIGNLRRSGAADGETAPPGHSPG